MAHYPFLIIGGGMAGDAAATAIRQHHPGSQVGLIGAESHSPYDRPPLTKGLWKDTQLDAIWRQSADLGIDLVLGRGVRGIEPEAHRVTDDQGTEYTYDKLLLATGAEPRRLGTAADNDLIYYRTLDDYHRLREEATRGRRVAVIGGGFIGSEIAAGLTMNKIETIMIFPDDGVCGRIFPRELADFMTEYYRQQGVKILNNTNVESIERAGDGFKISTRSKRNDQRLSIDADIVVVGIGVVPRVQLAADAGLEVAEGIVVNERLQTSHPDIYAAGDVALFYNPALEKQIRVEHEDNANTMGETAGRIMAGEDIRYAHLPFFYSDLFQHGYEAVGDTVPTLEIYEDWKDPFHEGVIYYLRDGRVRGVMTWNSFGHMDEARKLISDRRRISPEELRGRISLAVPESKTGTAD